MKKKHPLLTGALILSITGIFTRFMGFFYKIFLSRTIGAEGMGIYQMIFPVFGICFSLTATGVETAISRFVAGESAKKNPQGTRRFLAAGLTISLPLSLLIAVVLYSGANFLALHFLKEYRCAPLLRVLPFALPFAACHACICGYYYGLKKTMVPAISQLLEQTARVGAVFLLASIYSEKGIPISPLLAVFGLVIGEVIATLFCLTALSQQTALYVKRKPGTRNPSGKRMNPFSDSIKQLAIMALPLTGTRLTTNLLACFEAILIPLTLQTHGHGPEEAYGIYGTLTGMALSFILFPSVFTGSISVLLLPAVSEAQAGHNHDRVTATIRKTITLCLPFGGICTVFFLLTGTFLGTFFFHSPLAGEFIQTLAWICPFLYLNGTLNSILNGLGLTSLTFRNSILGIMVRILFILFCIPVFGIKGYLWGLLTNQLLLTTLNLFALKKEKAL